MKKIVNFWLVLAMLTALCPTVLVQASAPAFEPFKITVTVTGSYGGAGAVRLVVQNEFPFEGADEADALAGCTVSGTASRADAPSNYPETVTFEKILVKASSVRTDGKISLDLEYTEAVNNKTLQVGTAAFKQYTFDLTISPPEEEEPATVYNFEPFQLKVTALGAHGGKYPDGTMAIRLVVENAFPFEGAADENGVAGCKVSGTITETDNPDNVVTLDNVLVEASPVRSSGINLDLEYTEQINNGSISGTYSVYTYDLTVYPAEKQEELEQEIPEGTIFIKAEDFSVDMGTWTVHTTDKDAITGLTTKSGPAEPATVLIDVPAAGTYYVYGLAFDNEDGTRKFKLGVNGGSLPEFLGDHGGAGYAWEPAGSCELAQGEALIQVIDTSKYYARLKGIMLTPAENYTGPYDRLSEAFAGYRAELIERVETVIDPVMGHQVKYKINNRTQEPVSGTLYAAVYNEKKQLMEIKMQDVSLDANTSTGFKTIELSGTSAWTTGKIMFWDSALKPITASADFYFTQTDLNAPDEDADDYYGTNSDYMLDYQNPDEFNARSGISNTINKLKKNESITVGYIGTSITHGNTWRPMTTNWLKMRYPDADIKEVSIAASGTNSNLGASLVGSMLLEPHHPDLVFVEYVIDGGQGNWMEGIIRQIWEFDPTIDIYMVHPIHATNYEAFKTGGTAALVPTSYYEAVAEHYNIPSINMNYQIFDLYDQGKLTLKASQPEEGKILFSTDGIHPTQDGGYLYTGAVARGFLEMEASAQGSGTAEAAHDIPQTPLYEDHWGDACSTDDFSKVKLEGDWFDCTADAAEDNKYGTGFAYTGGYLPLIKAMMPEMKGTTTPGVSMNFKFKGTSIGLFEAGGQYCGSYLIQIDNQEPYVYDSFNTYCTRLRHQYFFIPEQEYGEHTVTITLMDEMPDKKTEFIEKYPDDETYNRIEAYWGRILVKGELLDANEV